MRKTTLTLTIPVIICLIIFFNLEIADANPSPFANENSTIVSPKSPIGVGTYLNTSIDIAMNYYVPINSNQVNTFSYSLDGSSNSTLPYTSNQIPDCPSHINYTTFKRIENLSNADHSLKVFAYFLNGTAKLIWTENFRVDTDFVPPKLTVMSPQPQVTYTNEIPIVFNINSPIIWQYYALDKLDTNSRDWIPFKGNITLSGLSEGPHSIIVSVQTVASRQTSTPITQEIISFNVINNIPLENIITIIAMIAGVLMLGLLLYKRTKAEDTNKSL